MTLLEEIIEKVPADQLKPEKRDAGAIAALVSKGRTTVIRRLIGVREILHTMGLTEGATFLDALKTAGQTNSVIKWGWTLIDKDMLDVSDPKTMGVIDSLVGKLPITPEQADEVKALAVVDMPVTPQEVTKALEGYEP